MFPQPNHKATQHQLCVKFNNTSSSSSSSASAEAQPSCIVNMFQWLIKWFTCQMISWATNSTASLHSTTARSITCLIQHRSFTPRPQIARHKRLLWQRSGTGHKYTTLFTDLYFQLQQKHYSTRNKLRICCISSHRKPTRGDIPLHGPIQPWGWIGPRVGLDAVGKRETSHMQGTNSR